MSAFEFAILSLATWRCASLIVHEEGPGNIFYRLREMVGIQHDDQNEIMVVPDRFLAKLLSCVWCASVWIGFAWMIAQTLLPTVTMFAGGAFALSAVAIWVERSIRGN